MSEKSVIFTALFGGYETLNEQPSVLFDGSVEAICFTDDPSLTSDSWDVRVIEPMLPFDLVRSQRAVKILGHPDLDEFDRSLYIDNSVVLRRPPSEILDAWLADGDLAMPLHSYGGRLIDEFEAVVALNYDESSRVYEQLLDYNRWFPDALLSTPHWNGFFARRPTPEVQRFSEEWFRHVLRYSRRDQLSGNVALYIVGAQVTDIKIDNFGSELHEWPVMTDRKIHLGKAPSRSFGPLLAEISSRDRRLSDIEEKLAEAEAAGKRLDAALRERLDDEGRARADADDERARREEAERRLAVVTQSRAWRATSPARRAMNALRR